jgi:acetyl esterase
MNEQEAAPRPGEERRAVRSRPARFTRLRTAAAVTAVVIAGLIALLALGTAFGPGEFVGTLASAFAWSFFGPQLVVLSLVAGLLCLPLWRARRRPVLRGIASSLAAIALVSSSVITGVMVKGAYDNGGSVNLAQALTLSTPSDGPDEVADYVTLDGEQQQARVFEPEGGAEGAPVMMYIHGGAWYMGSAEASDQIARSFASKGFYVVNIDYRLADDTSPTWDKAPADVACGLTWTKKQAAAAGANADQLTVIGDSAGGHLSMLLGWSAADGAAESSCPELGDVPVPDAVIASYPVADLTYTSENGTAPLGVDPEAFVKTFLGGSLDEQPERLEAVTPLTYVSDQTPPTLIVQPERDDFIPAEGNYAVADQAQRAGLDITLARVPFGYHGFDGLPGSIGGQTRTTIVLNWLQSLDLAP